MEEPREMSNLEQLMLYTVAHFWLHKDTVNGGDETYCGNCDSPISDLTKEFVALYHRWDSVAAMAYMTAGGYSGLHDKGMDIIKRCYKEITAAGYDAYDYDDFWAEHP